MCFPDSGATLVTALEVLRDSAVDMSKVIMLSLFASPSGLAAVFKAFPQVTVVTSAVHEFCCDVGFSQRYFGQ